MNEDFLTAAHGVQRPLESGRLFSQCSCEVTSSLPGIYALGLPGPKYTQLYCVEEMHAQGRVWAVWGMSDVIWTNFPEEPGP